MEIKCPGCGGELTYMIENHGSKVYTLHKNGRTSDLVDDDTDTSIELYCPNLDCEEVLTMTFTEEVLTYLSNNPKILD